MSIIKTQNLTYLYSTGTPFEIAAIKDVNIEIEQGELVGIIGHTGSGKSTLIQHLNGLLKPTYGKVYIDGQDIWEDKDTIKSVRFKVGLCFQYPEYQLFEETVYKDIAFGPKNMGLDYSEIHRRVHDAASHVGLSEAHLSKSPFDLSGGEKRRAAIAGVMAMQPKVLILDEPTSGLDPKGRDTILNMIKNYRDSTKSTVLIVSHSMEDIAKLATKVLVLNESSVAMYGTVDEIFSKSEEIIQMGLDVPPITRVFMGLAKHGVNVSGQIYTLEQGKVELSKLFAGKCTQGVEGT
ncbi:MAG: energy-coupling factor transporter ATPase [Oscillospiraceae bacterium]|jgi:energy-coupling factor transport system ATP-binding protein|nr:energy-coupling factor transporter ATPase [Oscillospiraceae bacterium]